MKRLRKNLKEHIIYNLPKSKIKIVKEYLKKNKIVTL